MATVGEQLRRAREDAGLTLHHVANQTKIQQWILAAIERDDMSQVPGGVFVRGYLMSYARAVGLDGERIWADYRAEMPVRTVESAPPPVPTRVLPVGPWTIVRTAIVVLFVALVWRNSTRSNPGIATPPASAPQERASDLVPAAAPTNGAAREAVAAVDSDRVAPAASPLQPAASPLQPTASPPQPAASPPQPAASPLQLRLHATSEVWLQATVDGEQRVYRLVMPGEDVSLDATREIALRIGDASALTFTINGAPGRPLGGPGVVRDIVISTDTYRTLVASDVPSATR
jgi:cytoskeletal protein RodZ